jgi:hypothetical protein
MLETCKTARNNARALLFKLGNPKVTKKGNFEIIFAKTAQNLLGADKINYSGQIVSKVPGNRNAGHPSARRARKTPKFGSGFQKRKFSTTPKRQP